AHGIMGRIGVQPRGLVPADTEYLTMAIDIGKFLCHWAMVAFRADGTLHLVEYGRLEAASDQLGEERAIMAALMQFREVIEAGWTVEAGGTSKETTRAPDQVWIDARYKPEVIFQFCRESGELFMPSQGY